jgi:hypothetical protein
MVAMLFLWLPAVMSAANVMFGELVMEATVAVTFSGLILASYYLYLVSIPIFCGVYGFIVVVCIWKYYASTTVSETLSDDNNNDSNGHHSSQLGRDQNHEWLAARRAANRSTMSDSIASRITGFVSSLYNPRRAAVPVRASQLQENNKGEVDTHQQPMNRVANKWDVCYADSSMVPQHEDATHLAGLEAGWNSLNPTADVTKPLGFDELELPYVQPVASTHDHQTTEQDTYQTNTDPRTALRRMLHKYIGKIHQLSDIHSQADEYLSVLSERFEGFSDALHCDVLTAIMKEVFQEFTPGGEI